MRHKRQKSQVTTLRSSNIQTIKATQKMHIIPQRFYRECSTQRLTSSASLYEQKLEVMIAKIIHAQLVALHKDHLYADPYNKRIGNLRMPLGYKPPKLQ